MIYLNSSGTNSVIVTLYEKCINITNPYFLWQIENKTTKELTYFYQNDNSTSPWYYNSFTISVATQSGLTAGILNNPAGEYTYTIWEMNEPYNLNVASASNPNPVETGILKIVATQSGIMGLETFTYSGTIPSFKNI
jgi:hypothetical protein